MKFKVGDIVKTKSIYENLNDSVCKIIEVRELFSTIENNPKFPYVVQFLNEPYKHITPNDMRAMFNEDEIIERITEDEAFAWLI